MSRYTALCRDDRAQVEAPWQVCVRPMIGYIALCGTSRLKLRCHRWRVDRGPHRARAPARTTPRRCARTCSRGSAARTWPPRAPAPAPAPCASRRSRPRPRSEAPPTAGHHSHVHLNVEHNRRVTLWHSFFLTAMTSVVSAADRLAVELKIELAYGRGGGSGEGGAYGDFTSTLVHYANMPLCAYNQVEVRGERRV